MLMGISKLADCCGCLFLGPPYMWANFRISPHKNIIANPNSLFFLFILARIWMITTTKLGFNGYFFEVYYWRFELPLNWLLAVSKLTLYLPPQVYTTAVSCNRRNNHQQVRKRIIAIIYPPLSYEMLAVLKAPLGNGMLVVIGPLLSYGFFFFF